MNKHYKNWNVNAYCTAVNTAVVSYKRRFKSQLIHITQETRVQVTTCTEFSRVTDQNSVSHLN